MSYNHHKFQGFSLIEIMVGMTVGLLGMIVVLQVFGVSENLKRSATSGGDAQQSGALALYELKRTIQLAGYGIAAALFEDEINCTDTTGAYQRVDGYQEANGGADLSFWLAPVVITNGANSTPDQITILYGNSPSISLVDIGSSTATTLKVTIGRTYGLFPGDVIVVMQAERGCMMAQITDNDNAETLTHLAGDTFPSIYTAANEISKYNKPGGMVSGTLHSYTSAAKLLNLGPNPRYITYSINGDNVLQANSSAVFAGTIEDVAADIVNLQAQYGVDTDDNGAVDAYVNPPNTTLPMSDWNGDGATDHLDWQRVKTIRVGLLARSTQRNPECNSQQPSWAGGAFDMGAISGWTCFNYRVFETVVPIRNLVWNPTPDA